MLPNWLYGKSKSKLASILGGGGTPTDYDQVKAQVTQNAEDILTLSDDMDAKAALTQITNRNLLDNPWFTVNQRSQRSYTELNKYTVDRWRTEGNSAHFSIDVVGDGVQLKRNVSEGYIALGQLNEASLLIPSKEYTLSILYSDGTVKFNTFTVPAYEQSYLRIVSTQSHMGCQAIIDRTSAGLYSTFILYDGDILTAPTIRALKLELGSISTLAMDTAPDMAIELAKCQRYFQRFKAVAIINFVAYAQDTNARATVVLPTAMRTLPAVTKSGSSDWLLVNGSAITAGTLVPSSADNQTITLKEDAIFSSVTNATMGMLRIWANATLDFDAEL